ncbi:MAG: hypothetical protein LUI13_01675 [Lachnospiraceae bacterium]|nr:hypothetical protein [Lachnospiraceae bacterium]
MDVNTMRERISELSAVEVRLQWEADLSLCLSVAADSDIPVELGGALNVLHEYLSGLRDKQEENVDHLLSYLREAGSTGGGGIEDESAI